MTAAYLLNESTSYRLHHMGLTVDGDVLDFQKYMYLQEIIDERAPVTSIIKAAQMGVSVAMILRAIEGQLHEGLRGTGYFFPTDAEVQDFSKARFDPILQQYGLAAKVNTAGLKQVGDGYVWFRAAGQRGGAKDRSLSQVKSFPADRVYLDEYDEMDPSRIDAIRHRLDGAEPGVREEIGLSTATVPEYGVDYDYKQSDMRSWFWRCHRCNGWTCLEQTWPDCIAEPASGEPHYVCSKCKKPLTRWNGEWVAARPEVKHHRGYYISQLCSPKKLPGQILLEFDDSTKRGRLREFYNQVLARPYADIDDHMTEALLNACLDRDRPRSRRSLGPCAMGVDVGARDLHYWVGGRITDADAQVYDMGVIESFDELGQIAKRHNVQCGVIDIGAETRKVREWLDDHSGWFGCQYVTKRSAGYDWNPRTRVVSAGRTEVLDASHQAIINKRDSFPAPDEQWHDVVVPQMCNLARVRQEDNSLGTVVHRWVNLGNTKNDHLKHAHGYFHMALERCSLVEQVTRAYSSHQTGGRPRSAMVL